MYAFYFPFSLRTFWYTFRHLESGYLTSETVMPMQPNAPCIKESSPSFTFPTLLQSS
jgi:hypothetical protein